MIQQTYIRILYTTLALLAVILVPYWAILCVVACGCFLFEWYGEAFIISLFADILYAAPIERFHHFMLVYTLITLIIFVVITVAKKTTRYGIS